MKLVPIGRPLLLGVLACLPLSGLAAETLTLPAAVERVLGKHPQLVASATALDASEIEAREAARPFNPELSLAVENVLGSGTYTGTDAMETTLAISQTLGMAQRRARSQAADANTAVARSELSILRLDLSARTARAFVDVVAAQERLALAEKTAALAHTTRETLDARAAAARATLAERNRARMAGEQAALAITARQRELEATRTALSTLWGSLDPDFSRADANIYLLPDIVDVVTLRSRLSTSPLIEASQGEQRLYDAEVRVAKAEARQPLTLSAGIRDFAGTGDNAFVLGASMPLALFERNRSGVARAEANRAMAQAKLEANRLDLERRVLKLHGDLVQTGTEFATLRERLLPLAQEALEQTRYGFDRGRFSYLELATAQHDLIDTELAAVDAAARYHSLLAELEALTGIALAQPASTVGENP